MVFFQPPEDIPLGQGAHIFAFAVEHRNGCVAVVLPFFQGLPQGEVIVDIHQVLLWGKEKQNVHHQLSYRKTNSAVVGAAPRLSDLILALFHSELKGIIILFRFYSQSFFALFQNMRKNHALWRILCYTKQKGTAHRALWHCGPVLRIPTAALEIGCNGACPAQELQFSAVHRAGKEV